MDIKLNKLNKTIVKCKKCPRLNTFIRKISKEKRKQNINDKYWGKPVTGFGNNDAKLPEMTLGEELIEDYKSLKLSLKAHPVSLIRHIITPESA